jgi:hypothetical protein
VTLLFRIPQALMRYGVPANAARRIRVLTLLMSQS